MESIFGIILVVVKAHPLVEELFFVAITKFLYSHVFQKWLDYKVYENHYELQ